MLLVRLLLKWLLVPLLVMPLMRLPVILLPMLDVALLTALVVVLLIAVDVVLLVTPLAKLSVMLEVAPFFISLPAPISRSANTAEAGTNRKWLNIFFMQCIPLCGRTDWGRDNGVYCIIELNRKTTDFIRTDSDVPGGADVVEDALAVVRFFGLTNFSAVKDQQMGQVPPLLLRSDR